MRRVGRDRGEGGFLREDLEGGREGKSGGDFLSLFRAIDCDGVGGYALLPRDFFMKIWK